MTFSEAHRAIKRGQLEQLKASIPAGLSADEANKFGWTLLMLAAIEGNVPIGHFLLSQGATINALNNFGESALSLAAHKGHLPFVQLLLKHGAIASLARPHGHDIAGWMRVSSGLTQDKIAAIVSVIETHDPKDS